MVQVCIITAAGSGDADVRHISGRGRGGDIENLYPLVAAVGYVEEIAVNRNVARTMELIVARTRCAGRADSVQVVPCTIKYLNAVVAVIAIPPHTTIADVNVACAIEGNADWPVKAAVVGSTRPGLP